MPSALPKREELAYPLVNTIICAPSLARQVACFLEFQYNKQFPINTAYIHGKFTYTGT